MDSISWLILINANSNERYLHWCIALLEKQHISFNNTGKRGSTLHYYFDMNSLWILIIDIMKAW